MAGSKKDDAKQQALRDSGAVHPHPEKVKDKLFEKEVFFDSRDLVQVKYEMLRRVKIDGLSVQCAARAFGLPRPSFYKAKSDFEQGGLAGLLPAKRGPRRAHKLSEPIMKFVDSAIAAEKTIQSQELARRVKERFGVNVNARSIDRALARRQKKTKS